MAAAAFIPPCLPSRAERPPSGPGWVYEIKHDGFRMMVRREAVGVRLLTRNGHDWADRYPLIADAARALGVRSCLIDGEAVACDGNGMPVFDRLRYRRQDAAVFLFAFDLIELNGQDLRREPIESRKRELGRLLRWSAQIGLQLNEHIAEPGDVVFAHACKMGLEGIVSKRLGSRYRSGRSKDWLKFKNPDAPAVKREAEEDWGKEDGADAVCRTDRPPSQAVALHTAYSVLEDILFVGEKSMWIKSFRLTNYKSFEDSGGHTLARHMNVIVGQNNVGKTALLQAIAQRLTCQPHRNSDQRRGQTLHPTSQIDLDFVATGQEIGDTIMAGGSANVNLPESWRETALNFLELPEVTLSAAFFAGRGAEGNWARTRFPSTNIITAPGENYLRFTFAADTQSRKFRISSVEGAREDHDDLGATMGGAALKPRVFFFNALRMPASQSPAGSNSQLSSDAENLPEVLNTLQPSRTLFKSYVDQVRRVLPIVKWIDVRPVGSHSEIRVWNVDETTMRDDLPNPLSECGTGVGQVLAILYIVMRETGDVICIDEPNSFLHPGAAKTLMAILNEHKEHQYIIATHSPEIIVAARPERLFMLTFANEKTTLRELNQSDIESCVRCLTKLAPDFRTCLVPML
jgi:bifunctional non-homologous end joining protein LigD